MFAKLNGAGFSGVCVPSVNENMQRLELSGTILL